MPIQVVVQAVQALQQPLRLMVVAPCLVEQAVAVEVLGMVLQALQGLMVVILAILLWLKALVVLMVPQDARCNGTPGSPGFS